MTGYSEVALAGGRFELLRELGRGGMGVVYEAFDRERGVGVALKTLRGVSPERLYSLKSEFRAVADLRHPNLVALHELFATDVIAGTPVFMAPEQAAGAGISELSDWYSFGILIYNALAGRPPPPRPQADSRAGERGPRAVDAQGVARRRPR